MIQKLLITLIVLGSNLYAGYFDDAMNAYKSGDKAKAVKLYTKACDGGNMVGCTNLGDMYSKGNGVGQDIAKAVKLYSEACHGGDMLGCVRLSPLIFK